MPKVELHIVPIVKLHSFSIVKHQVCGPKAILQNICAKHISHYLIRSPNLSKKQNKNKKKQQKAGVPGGIVFRLASWWIILKRVEGGNFI